MQSLESRRRASAKYYAANKDLCKARTAEVNKRRQKERYAYIKGHFLKNPCVDCGEADIRVLEFDHRDRSQKGMHVSVLARGYSMKRLIAEIAKCDVRCCNCHRIRTSEQLGWWRTLEEESEECHALLTIHGLGAA